MVKITGVIMAGGRSSRMGTEKGLITFKGKSLVEYSIDILKPFCEELLFSTSNFDYSRFGFHLVEDEIQGCGPIGGILSALRVATTNSILILACDMPFISSSTIQALIDEVGDFDCIVPEVGGNIEPLCAIYSRSLIPIIENKIKKNEYALYRLIDEVNCKRVKFQAIQEFRNFNTPDELI